MTPAPRPGPDLRISPMGERAVLADAADDLFDPVVQRRIWALAGRLRQIPWVEDAVPGMNNLLVLLREAAPDVAPLLGEMWAVQEPLTEAGRVLEIPTVYGGDDGPELADLAVRAGLSVREAVERHAAPLYGVGAIGAMPGFAYLFGLDPALAAPRLSTPRPLRAGAVIIGGAQAGVMPIDAPSGWRAIGRAQMRLFDLTADPPSRLQPGDHVRFVIARIAA